MYLQKEFVGWLVCLKNLREAARVLLKLTLGYQLLLYGREGEGILKLNELVFVNRIFSSLARRTSPTHHAYFHSLCKGYLVLEVSVTCWSIPLMVAGELCHIPKFFPTVLSLLHLNSKKECRSSWKRETRVA